MREITLRHAFPAPLQSLITESLREQGHEVPPIGRISKSTRSRKETLIFSELF
jgi:hypothetical protein